MRWLRWVFRAVLAIVVFSVLLVGTTAVRVWWAGRQDSHPHSDVIIVLGAAQYNGQPSPILKARLDHAVQLFQGGVATHLLTLGGNQAGDRTTEGATGASYLVDHGVPTADVIAVPTGNDTLRSLEAARDVMSAHHWTTSVIVTDPWHALRAGTMANDLGMHSAVSPVTNGPVVQSRGTEARYIWRETWAFLFYSLFGDTPSDVPNDKSGVG